MFSRAIFATAFVLILPLQSRAEMVTGVTVAGSTSTTTVGNTNGIGNTVYYIPLSGAYSGTYGVTAVSGGTAGTVSDTGNGYGYDPASALTMYMRYSFSSSSPSSASAISFDFIDLDLKDIEDPTNFFESVQFSYYDDSGTEVALTDTLLDASEGFGFEAVTTTLTYGGRNDPLNITFSGSALTNIMNDVIDSDGLYQNEFYLKLRFGSDYTHHARNTSEELMTSSITANFQAVPEPSSLLMSSILLGSISFWRRKRKN